MSAQSRQRTSPAQCDTCRNNEPVEYLRGAHVEFRDACIYQIVKYPCAVDCKAYESRFDADKLSTMNRTHE